MEMIDTILNIKYHNTRIWYRDWKHASKA